MEKDNFWQKFLEYKHLRDSEISNTILALKAIVKEDVPFSEIVTLNSTHEHYESMKELVDALQIYHSSVIHNLQAVIDTLSADVNYLD